MVNFGNYLLEVCEQWPQALVPYLTLDTSLCRFLNENPQYIMAGVTLSQFSFQIPKPLFDGYVRKRSSSNTSDANRMKRMRAMSELERNLNATQGVQASL